MSAARKRSGRWETIRNRHIRREPLCRICLASGIVTAATCVDHIIPLLKGGSDAAENLQSLCDACHEKKTNDDLGRAQYPEIGEDGVPVDEADPWRRAIAERKTSAG